MKKEKIEIYASELESELYKVAYDEIKFFNVFDKLKVFQSNCDFNLYWFYSIAPEVVLHLESIDFLIKHISNFKRKLTIKELIRFDLIICLKKPENFEEFKKNIKK